MFLIVIFLFSLLYTLLGKLGFLFDQNRFVVLFTVRCSREREEKMQTGKLLNKDVVGGLK